MNASVATVLGLQRTIGNQAVQRLIRVGLIQRLTRLNSTAEAVQAAEAAASAWKNSGFQPKPHNTGRQDAEYLPGYLSQDTMSSWANKTKLHGYFRRASPSASSPVDIDLKLAPSEDVAVLSDFNYHIQTKVEESPDAKAKKVEAKANKASAKTFQEEQAAARDVALAEVNALGKAPDMYKNKINWAQYHTFNPDGAKTSAEIQAWLLQKFPELASKQGKKK